MSEFITGKEIREQPEIRIRPFEFFKDYIKKGGLQPHDRFGRPIPPPDVVQKIKTTEKDLSDAIEEYARKAFLMSPAGQKQRRMRREYDAIYGEGLSSRSLNDDEVIKEKDLLKAEKTIKTLEEELSLLKKAYSWKDYSLPESEKEAEKTLNRLDGYLYIEKEFLKIAENPNLPLPDKKFEESSEQPVKEVEPQESVNLKKGECLKDSALMQFLKECDHDIVIVWRGIVKDTRDRGVSIANSEVLDLQEAAKYIMEDPDYSFKRLKAEDFVDDENLFREARDAATPKRYFRETLNQAMIHKYIDKKDITKIKIRNLLPKKIDKNK